MSILSDLFEAFGTLGVSVRSLASRAAALERSNAGADLTNKRSGKDANGIFTILEWWTNDATPLIVKRSTLSNATNGLYATRVQVIYNTSGVAVETRTYSLTYDADGDLAAETLLTVA